MQNQDYEKQLIRDAIKHNASGLIIFPVDCETYNSEILKLSLEDYSVIILDRKLKGLSLPLLSTDHYASAYELTSRIIKKGYGRICLFMPHYEISSIEERQSGYGMAMQDNKLFPDYLDVPVFQKNEIEKNLRSYMEANPDIRAFITSSGMLEIVLNATIEDLGINDSFVAVYDDEIPSYLPLKHTPNMRVVQNADLIGETCAQMLYDNLTSDKKMKSAVIPYEIIEKTL